ncbi:MAG: acyl-CoA dehydratase activase [Actinomycetota bacterium]|nr:acyl-CoA dehydratase activase [Actinomycetota bacterium]
MQGFLGVDVGSVSTNLAMLDADGGVISYVYLRTQGQPIMAVQQGLMELEAKLDGSVDVIGVGTTGSARYLTSVVVGGDIVKNEITAHAVAAGHVVPGVRVVLEIGGQDSKIIFLRDGIVVDFAMNTVCAAGTGSFLDHQSARLGIPIEDFGRYALGAEKGALIAGRCSVFAESDMVHKQQVGYKLEEIIYGLCQALVRNYLNNLAKGRDLAGPIAFQGGVAANAGMKKAFEEAINQEVQVPEHFSVMGAIGAALLAKEEKLLEPGPSAFKGFGAAKIDYRTSSFACGGCENNCEIIKIVVDDETLARWGGRCGKWEVDIIRRQHLEPIGADCSKCG